ncbi:CapA family protein, partial [Candidatus Woesebacteria bacterium]|nr:CapA family protein [Candidatus Woesebacteria bacterium]
QRSGKDHIFSRMQPFISQHDLVVANLEGPVTDNESVSLGSIVGSRENFIFTFEPLVPQLLHDANIKVVNLGNNHINNFGSDGVQQTKERLTAASISYFGNITGEDTEDSVVEQTIGDVRFGFVNFNQFAPRSLEVALADIASLGDKVDFIIVYTHWGNEYELTINEVLRQQAQAMIDAGADMIIGSHPHVIQPSEVYKGKYIYYSLGNFVFDQYFDENVQTGLLLSVAFSSIDGSIKPIEHRIHLEKGGQTILLEP